MSNLPPQLQQSIVIQDSIHGRIWLTELERELIGTPGFQRLRNISQLGGAQFVFPTATHSRFAHSLGATHVMGRVLSQPSLQEYFGDTGKAVLVPALRAAALLHDIGHFPFSHLGENIWALAEEAEALRSEGLTPFDMAAYASRPSGASRASHEHLTARMIREGEVAEIINRHLGTIDGKDAAEIVAEMVAGEHTDLVGRSLLSSDLDCDRLDYLIRDSQSAGLNYGVVDLDYLVENLIIGEHPEAGPVLAINKRHGSQAVEHYLLARYFHYAQFITHKTTAAAELLIGVVMLELIRLKQLPGIDELEKGELEGRLIGLTDAMVWAKLDECRSASWAQSAPDLREAAERLLSRALLKCAANSATLETKGSVIPLDDLENVREREAIANAASVSRDCLAYKRVRLPLVGVPTKGTEERITADVTANVAEWVKTVKLADGAHERAQPLVDQEGLVRYLSEREWVTRRVFVREDLKAAKGVRPRTDAVKAALLEAARLP